MIWIPTYRKLIYELDRDTGRYQVRICPPGFSRVPAELIIEDTQSDEVKAEQIIRGPYTYADESASKRRLKFFTGLRPCRYTGVFEGNVLTFGRDRKRVQNFILFRFSSDANRLTLLYWPGFRPYPDKRNEFIAEVIGRGLL